jgi:hypothetical protein
MKKLIATFALLATASFGSACDMNTLHSITAGPDSQTCSPPSEDPHPINSCETPKGSDTI